MSSVEFIQRLSYSTETDDETTRFLNQIHEQAVWGRERRRLRWAVWLWFTTTMLLGGFSIWLTARRPFTSHFGSFETGYGTDFSTPSREIDVNWYDLHLGEGHFFIVTEDEAREAWGPEYVKYWEPRAGGYVATVEVMHLIHCLASDTPHPQPWPFSPM
ncbi:hypothetical protein CGCTS75_v006197 [Colletotrichum tropicale]|nr:hypothetical protein CGCTS75_v006197 [Colletotrichum tropicale]